MQPWARLRRVRVMIRACLSLVLNAVREINCGLEVVTDATEHRVLIALLRGESL